MTGLESQILHDLQTRLARLEQKVDTALKLLIAEKEPRNVQNDQFELRQMRR